MATTLTRKDLILKYTDTLAKIEKDNPKEDGTPYDQGVCLDMLISDYTSHKVGTEPRYKFEGIDEFDWDAFGEDYAKLP